MVLDDRDLYPSKRDSGTAALREDVTPIPIRILVADERKLFPVPVPDRPDVPLPPPPLRVGHTAREVLLLAPAVDELPLPPATPAPPRDGHSDREPVIAGWPDDEPRPDVHRPDDELADALYSRGALAVEPWLLVRQLDALPLRS